MPSEGSPPTPEPAKAPPKDKKARTKKPVESAPPPRVVLRVESETKRTVKPHEPDDERASRLRREERALAHTQLHETILLCCGIFVFLMAGLGSLTVLSFSVDSSLKNWATATLTSLLAGFVSFLLGKWQSKSS